MKTKMILYALCLLTALAGCKKDSSLYPGVDAPAGADVRTEQRTRANFAGQPENDIPASSVGMVLWQSGNMYVNKVMLDAGWTPINRNGQQTGGNSRLTGQPIHLEQLVNREINLLHPDWTCAFRLPEGLYRNLQFSIVASQPLYPGVHAPAITFTGRFAIYDNFVPVDVYISDMVTINGEMQNELYVDLAISYTPVLTINPDLLTYGIAPQTLMNSTTVMGRIIISETINVHLYRQIKANLNKVISVRYK
jgi:hypothetical protein